MMEGKVGCPLCSDPGGVLLWQDDLCRVVYVEDPDYPGFCRVIWNAHVAEMTDLEAPQRAHLMGIVFTVESIVREALRPDKVNLASLGNVVPHLHWHIIPRFRDDPHFPEPIWGTRRRPPRPCAVTDIPERIAHRLMRSVNPGNAQEET